MEAGETEVKVKVENEAGSIEVTVPVIVVGADPLSQTVPGSTVLLNETFVGATSQNFWEATYKSIPGTSLPMYYPTGNQSKITFIDGQMTIDGARFAIGQTDSKPTEGSDTIVYGSFDFSKNWKVQIHIITTSGSSSKKFQVQVDNNTETGSNSIHGSKSRIFNKPISDLNNNTTITLSSAEHGQFTPNSFLFLRTESNATVVIDQILVETWE